MSLSKEEKQEQKKALKTNKAFYRAVMKGDIDKAQEALDAGADVNFIYNGNVLEKAFEIVYSQNPLVFYAVSEKNIDMVNLFLENGIDANIRKTNWDNTPLLVCALERFELKIATAIFDKGADPHAKNADGEDALYWAEKRGAYDLLQRMKAVPRLQNTNDRDVQTTSEHVKVIEEDDDHGHLRIEHTYYFDRRERMTLAMDHGTEKVEAMTMTSFDLMSKETLRAAFNIYKERGGKKTEEEIIYGQKPLNKPILDPKKQNNG